MSETILSCPPLTVRSSKAGAQATRAAKNNLKIDNARYQVSGIEAPTLKINGKDVEIQQESNLDLFTTDEHCQAVFFDQTSYMFSIELENAVEAYLFSPLATWCENSDWNSKAKILSIPVNFGNDLGDFQLCWEWKEPDGTRYQSSFSGQVYSTKLDIYNDFQIMLTDVQKRLSWVKLDLLKQTTWGWSHDSDLEMNLRTWLLIFHKVRSDMGNRFRILVQKHHRRLHDEIKNYPLDRIKKISSKLEDKIYEKIITNPNKRFPNIRKKLSVDTIENRYIKYLLFQTISQLLLIISKIKNEKKFSDIFVNRLVEWANEWSNLSEQRFWKEIGEFKGLRKTSLVLSQDPLYSGIIHSYNLLQEGLKLLDQNLKGGIQDAATLYEIWCLVKMDQIIIDLGWVKVDKQVKGQKQSIDSISNDLDEFNQETWIISYKREEYKNINLKLLYQPKAKTLPNNDGSWDGILAIPVPQQPDIVLRLYRNDLPRKPIYTWIFDAKYRINLNNAPNGALNHMHRYRDAVLWASNLSEKGSFTRESIGAYVLYPGNENDLDENSEQIISIKKTNIGALPLRPNSKSEKLNLLKEHVKNLLEISVDFKRVDEKQNEYFIGVPNIKTNQKHKFLQCITKSKDGMNTKKYWEKCRIYRLPDKHIKKHNLDPNEWTFLIPSNKRQKLGIFPILSVTKLKRIEILKCYEKIQVQMHHKPSLDNDLYWLFKLGEPLENMPKIKDIDKKDIILIDKV